MPWVRHTVNSRKLQQQNDRLTSALIQVREQLQIAERHRVGLEVLLSVRQERIDALTTQVEQLRRQLSRRQNRRRCDGTRRTAPGNVVSGGQNLRVGWPR
jgi:hypothetical protein